MARDVYFLGWDVGTWKCTGDSEDALQMLKWQAGRLSAVGQSFRGNLLLETKGERTVEALIAVTKLSPLPPDAALVVGIDAVFGWPRQFVELLDGKADYIPKVGKEDWNTDNKYLHRETERFLVNTFGLKSPNRPKTAVGDAIGSAGTKAQFFLAGMRKGRKCYVPPVDPWDAGRASKASITVIEVYPGVTVFSRSFGEIDVPSGTKVAMLGKGDAADSMRCALVGACYANTVGLIQADLPSVYVPSDAQAGDGYDVEAIPTEGWIFTPK
jgi:hypothetical protein